MDSQKDLVSIPTPFAQHSWEPRFAFDGRTTELDLIQLGLSCCLAMDPFRAQKTDRRFIAFAVSTTRLAVAAPDFDRPDSLNDTPRFADTPIGDAARSIQAWLENEAEYPQRPWFDGGESRGFQMFHVPWCREYKAYKEFFGYALIEPKWYEIHK